MNVLDWCLVALVGIYALSGYWQGFITGASATAGLLLGGLAGIWVAPLALGDAAPSLWVSLGALFIVIISASLGPGAVPVRRCAACASAHHLAADPGRRRRRRGSVLSAVAVLLVAWALGVAVSGSRIGGITPIVRLTRPVLAEVDEYAPRPGVRPSAPAPSTTWSARRSSRATSSRSPGADRPGRPRLAAHADGPGCSSPRQPSVLKVRGSNSCGSGVEGTGFLYPTWPADHQRARRRRRAPGPRSSSAAPRSRRRSCSTTPPSTSPSCHCPTTGSLPPRLRHRGPAPGPGGRRWATREDGPYDVEAGRDPLRAAAALARHLRRGHRHPPGLLAARTDPAGQLRRPDRDVGRRRGRAWSSPRPSATATPATRSPRTRWPGRRRDGVTADVPGRHRHLRALSLEYRRLVHSPRRSISPSRTPGLQASGPAGSGTGP